MIEKLKNLESAIKDLDGLAIPSSLSKKIYETRDELKMFIGYYLSEVAHNRALEPTLKKCRENMDSGDCVKCPWDDCCLLKARLT